jgi:uncharacterized protein (TIGR03067 family)
MRSKSVLALFALALTLTLGVADEAANKKDQDALQGDWEAVALEANGNKASDEEVAAFRRSVTGNNYKVTIQGQVRGEGTFKVDAAKSPKTIDVTAGGNSPQKGTVIQGIYKVEGDTFTMCYAPPGMNGEAAKPRPTEFKGGQGYVLTVWKKAKK